MRDSDGPDRPTCSKCQDIGTECHYETEKGESRWSALKRQKQALEAEHHRVVAIMERLRTSPEGEALDLFHHLRQGEYDNALEIVLQNTGEGIPTAPSPNVWSANPSERRLPPISTIFEVSQTGRDIDPGPPGLQSGRSPCSEGDPPSGGAPSSAWIHTRW